jgi:hypothetical protein
VEVLVHEVDRDSVSPCQALEPSRVDTGIHGDLVHNREA